jgi:hypothetical protein
MLGGLCMRAPLFLGAPNMLDLSLPTSLMPRRVAPADQCVQRTCAFTAMLCGVDDISLDTMK